MSQLVTVVIPVYNAEKYIERCMDSILKQTYDNIEVLAINDGSSDGSLDILKRYEENDARVRVINQKNMGVAKTRDKGVREAKGEYIAFIDNDDYIDNDYIEKLLPRKGEEVVISGFRRPDIDGKVVQTVKLADAEWSKFVNPTPWAKIYRKDFLVTNKITFLDNNIGEDIYFNLIAMLVAKNVRITNYIGYNWFFNNDSISNTKHKKYDQIDVMKLLDKSYEEVERRGLLERNYTLMEFFFYRFIVWFMFYAGKGATKDEVNREYDELFGWLRERFPKYQKNKMLKGSLPGESTRTRMIYKVVLLFQKMGLSRKIFQLYAK